MHPMLFSDPRYSGPAKTRGAQIDGQSRELRIDPDFPLIAVLSIEPWGESDTSQFQIQRKLIGRRRQNRD